MKKVASLPDAAFFITAWRLCCGATKTEFKQKRQNRKHETLVIQTFELPLTFVNILISFLLHKMKLICLKTTLTKKFRKQSIMRLRKTGQFKILENLLMHGVD